MTAAEIRVIVERVAEGMAWAGWDVVENIAWRIIKHRVDNGLVGTPFPSRSTEQNT